MAFQAGSYSNEVPFLRNTGTGQVVLSEAYRTGNETNVLSWLYEEKVDRFTLMSRFPKQVPELLQAIDAPVLQGIGTASAAGMPWCTGDFTDPPVLCQTLLENSPISFLPGLAAAGVPMESCHSPDDEVIPIEMTQFFLAPFADPYVPPVDILAPQGRHGLAHILCASAIPTFLSTANEGQELLSLIVDISTDNNGNTCPGSGGSSSATLSDSPTMAPTREDNKGTTTFNPTTMAPSAAGGRYMPTTRPTTMAILGVVTLFLASSNTLVDALFL